MRGVTSYVDGELDEHLSPSILFVVESSVMSFLMREKSYIDVTVGLTPPSIFGRKRKVEEEKSYIAVKDEKSYIQSPSIWLASTRSLILFSEKSYEWQASQSKL